MNLFAKLGLAGFLVAGVGVPTVFAVKVVSTILGKHTGRVFNISSPFLQSRSSKSSINLYLDLKNGSNGNADKSSRLFWRVEDLRDSRDQEFFNQHGRIVVYSTGNIRLKINSQRGEIAGLENDIELEEKNRFKIIGSSGSSGTKEVKLSEFKFKTICNKWGDKKEECDIEIEDSVGLKWGEKIKPRVVFWS